MGILSPQRPPFIRRALERSRSVAKAWRKCAPPLRARSRRRRQPQRHGQQPRDSVPPLDLGNDENRHRCYPLFVSLPTSLYHRSLLAFMPRPEHPFGKSPLLVRGASNGCSLSTCVFCPLPSDILLHFGRERRSWNTYAFRLLLIAAFNVAFK